MNIEARNLIALTAMLFSFVVGTDVHAQKDSIYLNADGGSRKSSVRGQIVKTSAFVVTVEADGKRKEVPVSRIKKISFAGEPRSLTRAKDHADNQRYDDCLDALQKIDDVPDSKFIKQEIKFLEAYATGRKSLRGDQTVTSDVAQRMVNEFIKGNSDSYRLVLAVDLYGQLLMSNGKTEQAQKEFNRLTKSKWDDYVVRGHFYEGETLIHQNKFAEARQSFESLMNLPGTSGDSRQLKLLAECQLAKISALQGDIAPAITTIEKIIRDENADNSRLFACAYNALGTCYLKSNQLKKACRAFLHTELLFSAEPDAHAEALYNLAKIWPQLNQTDRANRARELLTTRYRSTIWATKL